MYLVANSSPASSYLQIPCVVCSARQEMSNACAELEGQGSGTGDTGQDVGSPAKKMRTGSGFAHGRDPGTAICQTQVLLHHGCTGCLKIKSKSHM